MCAAAVAADVAWDLECFGAIPSGLIKEDDHVCTRGHLGCDLVEIELHGLAIARRQHKRGAGAVLGTDRTEQVRRFSPLIVSGAGA